MPRWESQACFFQADATDVLVGIKCDLVKALYALPREGKFTVRVSLQS